MCILKRKRETKMVEDGGIESSTVAKIRVLERKKKRERDENGGMRVAEC